MPKNRRKRTPKTILKLPDLEQSKSAVLNSLPSISSRRSYEHAIREFIDWYGSEPRHALQQDRRDEVPHFPRASALRIVDHQPSARLRNGPSSVPSTKR